MNEPTVKQLWYLQEQLSRYGVRLNTLELKEKFPTMKAASRAIMALRTISHHEAERILSLPVEERLKEAGKPERLTEEDRKAVFGE